MIVSKNPSWWRILFTFRGTALQRVWRRVLFTTSIAVVVTVIDLGYTLGPYSWHGVHFHEELTLSRPFSLIGVALGIFLGFRNNTSYDRFWEGRKLWGRMVNTSRSITRQVLTLIGPMPNGDERPLTELYRSPYFGETPGDKTEAINPDVDELLSFHREMVRRVAAYVHSFRMHLRDERDFERLRGLMPDDEIDALDDELNPPIAILQTLGDRLREAWQRGWVHSQHVPVIEGSLTQMTDIQGGCERIKSTPIPYSYTALIHRIVAVYCFAVPFGIVNEVQEFTPVVVAIISYAFFGLDAVGDEIEDPFGTDDNDLPLTAISTMIEVNVRQRISDADLPKIPKPVDQMLQ